MAWIFLLPFDHGGSPCQPGPEYYHQDEVSPLNSPLLDRFIEGYGHRSRGGIAVFIEIHKDLLGLYPKALGDRIDDAPICLVGDDAFDVGNIDLASTQSLLTGCVHGRDRALEGFLAVHTQMVQPAGNC